MAIFLAPEERVWERTLSQEDRRARIVSDYGAEARNLRKEITRIAS